MSAFDMLDMCVRYIAHRHEMLTEEHVAILNQVWAIYEYPPLPASPPPEMAEWNERVRQAKEAVAEAQRPFLAGQNPFTREFDPLMAVKHQVDGLVSAQQVLDEVLEQQPGVQPQVWASQPTHIFFDQQEEEEGEEEEQGQFSCDDCIRQHGLNTARYLNPEDYEAEHRDTCVCEVCEWQYRETMKEETCDADRCTYECGAACGSSEAACGQAPCSSSETIDLTCEKPACTYGCICDEAKNLLAPAEGCLYGCNYACGTNYGENCTAIFDANGNQVMPEDDMPPLVPLAAYATPRGWFNPEEDSEDEGPYAAPKRTGEDEGPYAAPKRTGEDEGVAVPTVPPQPQPQPKPPKEKSPFPYNHPRWPSPRAKALVKGMIARGETSMASISSVLNKPVKSLNHETCMHFLAKRYRLSPEQLLETSIYDLHNPPSAPYWGTTHPCGCTFCKQEKRGY